MREELLKGLTEEQIAKVKACKNQEEMLAVAKEEGIELTDEQLEAVSGGHCYDGNECIYCGSENTKVINSYEKDGRDYVTFKCFNCGRTRENLEWYE